MKWKNHLEIANAVSDQLGLPEELRRVLRQGSIQPDREGDKTVVREGALLKRRRVRHHHASKRFIRKLLWKARTAYLEGKEEDALWNLGRALHYVQDRSVATGPWGWFHDRRESEIGLRHGLPRAFEIGEEASAPSPLFIELCLRSLSPRRDSGAAMHQACMLSSALAFSVMSNPIASIKMRMEIELSERMLRMVAIPLAIAMAASISSIGILLGQPILVALALPPTALVLILGARRRRLRMEAGWFIPEPRERKHLVRSDRMPR
jgi:hypothetical protein